MWINNNRLRSAPNPVVSESSSEESNDDESKKSRSREESKRSNYFLRSISSSGSIPSLRSPSVE